MEPLPGAVPAPPRVPGPRDPVAPAELPLLSGWRRTALASLALASVFGGATPTGSPPAPSSTSQSQSVSPAMVETRQRIQAIEQPDLDPFVYTLASEAWAGLQPTVDRGTIHVDLDSGRRVWLHANVTHGRDAPMLLVIPGAFGDKYGDKVNLLEQVALDHGMNFVAIDNPLEPGLQMVGPQQYPGNPEREAADIYDTLRALRQHYPAFFRNVSITGYSYGGLLSVGVLDAQQRWLQAHPTDRPIITGSIAAVSPPESLPDSMRALDEVHHSYDRSRVGSYLFAFMHYEGAVRDVDFQHLDVKPYSADLATDRMLVDDFGFRFSFEDMVTQFDVSRGINRLPLDRAAAAGRLTDAQHDALADQQRAFLRDYSYDDYEREYLVRDGWFAEHHVTPQAELDGYRYSRLLERVSGSGVPVMTLVSADDFILNPQNVASYRRIQANPRPQEATMVYDRGGHTAILYNPDVREAIGGFLSHPPR